MASLWLSLLFLCAAGFAVRKAHAVCPSGTIQGLSPNDCFTLQPTASSWLAAEESCARGGGHLASISSQFTNSFLVSKVLTPSCSASKYWLGGTYNLLQNGGWTWSDGRRFSFTNWGKGQPLTDGTFCLSVDVQAGQWYSESCGDAKPSLCRVPALATRSSTTTPLPPPAGKCPEGWVHIEQTNKCYQIPIDATSWNEGLAECKSLGGTLASIPSAAANAALFEFANNTAADGPLHIGLYRGNGSWRWTDGTPVTYTNWLPNYPLSGTGNCANFHDTYWTTNQDKWYPVYCDYGNYYPLCQCDPIV